MDPLDLTTAQIDDLFRLSTLIRNPALVARLGDVVWCFGKKREACEGAAEAYFHIAGLHCDEPFLAADAFSRGLYLASRLGREKPLYLRGCDGVVDAARTACAVTIDYSATPLLQIVLDSLRDHREEFAGLATATAHRLLRRDKNPSAAAERYFELASQFLQQAGKKDDAEEARRQQAEAMVLNAERMASKGGIGYTMAAQILTRAVTMLSSVRAPRDRLNAVRAQLVKCRRESVAFVQSTTSPSVPYQEFVVAIEALAEKDAKRFAGLPLPEAIALLVKSQALADPAAIRAQVLDPVQRSLTSILFAPVVLDRGGWNAARGATILGDGSDSEHALLQESFDYARQWIWPSRAIFIEAARKRIQDEHEPTLNDLTYLVLEHPLIAPGHEETVIRGLHAGFHRDFLVASHLLVPQIEMLIRNALPAECTFKLYHDDTQEMRTLKGLIELPEFVQIFGTRWRFELLGVLTEKRGLGFRDNLAHGRLIASECESVAARMVWWFVLSILYLNEISDPDAGS